MVACGNMQQDYLTKEDLSLPTVATEVVLLTLIGIVAEKRDAALIEIHNAFIQIRVKDVKGHAIIWIQDVVVDWLVNIAPKDYSPFGTLGK